MSSSFKITITLESSLTSQELAEFFSALAQSEQGNMQPLFRVLHPVAPPPSPEPQVAEVEPPPPIPVTVVEPPPPAVTTEPPVSEDLKRRLMSTEISCERLHSIIRRHNWARGQKARIERRWGFSKASCFARIGFHFNDYSIMDGSVSSEQQLVAWLSARGYVRPL
jgi:hypothetical protein